MGSTPVLITLGEGNREQGISKAGSRHIRAVAMAWCWLRYQPRRRVSRWYQERFARGGARARGGRGREGWCGGWGVGGRGGKFGFVPPAYFIASTLHIPEHPLNPKNPPYL